VVVGGASAIKTTAGAQETTTLEEQVSQTERLFAALAAAAAEIPRDTFDPDAILSSIEPEPEAAFAWVRDNTVLVPYRGALRGPVGVLMDRVGNSLDRALPLSDLVQRLGYEARLARAHLELQRAMDLVPELRTLPGAGLTDARHVGDPVDRLRDYASRFDLAHDEAMLLQAFTLLDERDAQFAADLRERVERHAGFLLDAFAATISGPSVATISGPSTATISGPSTEPSAWAADLQDHWRVQYRRDGTWTDLDPSHRHAEPSWTVAPADAMVSAADTNAEALLALARCSLGPADRVRCADAGSAAETFEGSYRDGGWTVTHTASEVRDRARDWPPDAFARVEEQLDAGYLAIVPDHALTVAGASRVAW
jgi:hypothetical protein